MSWPSRASHESGGSLCLPLRLPSSPDEYGQLVANWSENKRAQLRLTRCRALSCPSWARTRTLLIQSQTCCQLHQGAILSSAYSSVESVFDTRLAEPQQNSVAS